MKASRPCNWKSVPVLSLLFLILGIVVIIPGVSIAALLFTNMDPLSGPHGTAVTINGSGFDLGKTYTFMINDMVCPLTGFTETTISFNIPTGAESGGVSITEEGATPVTYFVPFTVTRSISGIFDPPQAVSLAGYYVGTTVHDEAMPAPTGAFTVAVSDTGATAVIAGRDEDDPGYMAIVTSADNSVTVDASSTAAAFIFLSPYVTSRDDAYAQSILNKISGLSETAALASLIENLSADHSDYLENPQFEAALKVGIEAYLADPATVPLSVPLASAFDWEESPYGDSYFKYLNPPAATGTTQRLYCQLTPPSEGSADAYTLKVSSPNRNPLDWTTVAHQLDVGLNFPNGKASVDALNWDNVPSRFSNRPRGMLHVKASLLSEKLDLIEQAANVVNEIILGQPEEEKIRLSSVVPGVYMVRSYSGNVYYGVKFLNGLQADLLGQLPDGTGEWRIALIANSAIAALDAGSVVLDIKEVFKGRDIFGLIFEIAYQVDKATAFKRSGLDEAAIKQIIRAASLAVLKKLKQTMLEAGAKVIAKVAFKNLVKIIDVTGKISNALQAAERGKGLLYKDAFAVENCVIVVGQPFEPVIRSFSPRRGHVGSKVRIEGYNFDPDQTSVWFGSEITTDPNPPPAVEAEVIHATENSLLIKVPEGAKTSVLWIYTDAGSTSTWRLGVPYTHFEVIDPFTQVTLNVKPDPVIPGGVIIIEGDNFPSIARFFTSMNSSEFGSEAMPERSAPYAGLRVIFDGNQEEEIDIQAVKDKTIVVRAPQSGGGHTVQVGVGDSLTQSSSFTVGTGAGTSPGVTIYVTSTDDADNPLDPQVTLREAMLFATGGRLPQRHLEEEDPFVQREVDFIVGTISRVVNDNTPNHIGADYSDSVALRSNLWSQTSPTLFLSSPLPLPVEGDTIDLNTSDKTDFVIDGDALSGDVDAWSLDGISYTYVRNITFRNFPRHGIYLTGGATGNRTDDIRIQNCKNGTGVFFDQDATSNILKDTKVTGSGVHGLHMTGPGVMYNEIALSSGGSFSDSEQYGVLIEDGANANLVCPGLVENNPLEGILVRGEDTDFNLIGRNSLLVPKISEVYHNGASNNGPGIHLEAGVDHTYIRYFRIAGNAGDGILLEGTGCSDNQIQSVYTGVNYSVPQNPVEDMNGGSGIHLKNGASHTLIGGRLGGMFGWRNAICGNADHGILIEGSESAYNTINQSHIGSLSAGAISPYMGNGEHGIVLRDGTHHNIIGDRHVWLDNHIAGHTNGAGILIEGTGTDHNVIMGCQIGAEHSNNLVGAGNKIGIHLKNGPKCNVIGQMGDHVPKFFSEDEQSLHFPSQEYYEAIHEFLSGNVISNNTEAGIVFENCGGELNEQDQLEGTNIAINNYIGRREPDSSASPEAPNGVGIKLVSGAQANTIGGPLEGQGNEIFYNHQAGIEIDDCWISNSKLTNRISNNVIRYTGSHYEQPQWSGSHLDGYEFGIGVLVHQAGDNMIGHPEFPENAIRDNFVGVYADATNGTLIFNNNIDDNSMAGVVVRNSTGCEVGGTGDNEGNAIWSNGSGQDYDGGVIVSGGNSNRVQSNFIGSDASSDADLGNNGWGIVLSSSLDNAIGHPLRRGGNVVVDNTRGGILLTGSSYNKIQGNFIGVDREETGGLGNKGNGIQLDSGASSNVIGGEETTVFRISGEEAQGTQERGIEGTAFGLHAPNSIANNQGAGVAVDGSSTLSNQILFNAITNNMEKGIELTNGGNTEISPPIIDGFDGSAVNGRVTGAPDGSRVQVFSDDAGEGAQYLGETTVQNGAWTAYIMAPVFPVITATVTHGSEMHTSEFSTGHRLDENAAFLVTRTDGGTGSEVTGMPLKEGTIVLDLTVAADHANVLVTEIQFEASGNVDDAAQITDARLYLDADDSGTVTDVDLLLAGGQGETYEADDGFLTLKPDNALVEDGRPERWLLVLDFAGDVPLGASFQTRIPSSDHMTIEAIFPYYNMTDVGSFPVVSDQLEPKPGLEDLILVLQVLCGMTPEGVERFSDLNSDGVIGLAEAIHILWKVCEMI